MKARKIRVMLGILVMFFGVLTCGRQVDAANTYKVVYHFSTSQSTKTVVKRVNCGTKHTVLSGTKLNFSANNKYLAGWIARRQPTNRWALKKNGTSYWGLYLKNYLRYFTAGEKLVGSYKAGETIHLYGYWININKIDVTSPIFGASGKDKESDSAAIQKALNLASVIKKPITVYIPAGTYYLSSQLKVPSNTTLKLTKSTIMRRSSSMKSGVMVQVGLGINVQTNVGDYKQASNVTIDGGKWINDPQNSYTDAAVMRFHHCSNIVLKNGIFQDYSSKHAVIFVAASNVKIDSMTFQNHKLTKGSAFSDLLEVKPQSAQNGEAIHTDFAGKLDHALPYDGTICDNVSVTNCVFNHCYSGIGNHNLSTIRGSSFTVMNNTFKNVYCNCLNMYSRDNVKIYSNKMTNCGAFLADVDSTYEVLEYPVNAQGMVRSILTK